MRSALLTLALFALQLLSFAQGPDHVPGEVLVRLKPIAREADLRAELSKALPANITLKELKALGPKSRYGKVSTAGTGTTDQELEKLLARLPGVEATSLNYKVKHLAEPNDAQYGTQWNLDDINVEPVWEVTTGGTMANGTRIGVALSDLAIQTNHPDLSDNIWPNSPAQGNGADHGTEVASVLGAVGNNTIGIAGVNWDVEIFSSGETEDLSDVIEQFEAATFVREQFNASNGANGLLVVSITASWGVENAGTCNGFMEPLFTGMTAAGILLVASGPNDSVSIESGTDFPANCALAEHLVVTSYGPNNETPFAFGPSTVHLLAPGVDIPVATVPSTYAVYDGNSFAIPTVAGAVALLYSIPCPSFADLVMNDPVAARQLVKDAILNNTAFFPGGNALTITGGKLDVHAAYQALMAACVPTCTDYTITLTTIDEPVASWTIRDVDNAVVLTGSGNTIATCLDDGCYTISLNGSNGLPMEADYLVEDANGEVAIGNSFGGIIQFGVGAQIPGCTIVGSANYDPQANCNDGSCCNGEMVQVVVLPDDFQTEGTADLVVTSNGGVLFNGSIDIVFDPEFGAPVGGWQGCAPDGCFIVQVSNPSMPLGNEGFVFVNGDLGDPEGFPISTGYFALIGGAVGTEVCDGLDNDCDGLIDEDFIWYVDADNDGWGVVGSGAVFCSPPTDGFAQVEGDCDDANAVINPGAQDLCSTPDGIDNNCDGNTDEGGLVFLYTDLDGDGYGTDEVLACGQGPGLALEPGDCDDADVNVFPGAPELCDGLDNDCDGELDEDFLWYTDADDDGFGSDATVQVSCTPLAGHVQVGGDCDDGDANITVPGQTCDDGNPATSNDQLTASCICLGTSGNCPPGEVEDCNGNCAPADWIGDGVCDDGSFEWEGTNIFFNCAEFNFDGGDCQNCVTEVCDGLDNDCDGQVDEDFFWYVDADGDGHGDPLTGTIVCEPGETGFSSDGDDCDDTNAAIYIGAVEVCDGIDNNCDGITDGTTVDFQTGCADPMACNYDSGAVCGNGTCVQGSSADGSETFATDFTATDVNGNPVNLFALLGQGKTVVLDFFTTWCAPSNTMNNAGFLQDWYAHMGPAGLDLIRMFSIEIEDTATVTGSLAPFLQDATWPFIASGGGAIAQQYGALDLYNGFVPTVVMICPDRSAQVIYPQPDELPYAGLFQYDQAAALQLLNENCGCRGTPCLTNIGCMDVNACNYDPSATCPGPCTQAQEWFTDLDGDGYGTTSLGTACTQPTNSASLAGDCNDNDPGVQVGFDLYVLSESENDFGSAHYVITQGNTVIEGDIQLPEETQGIGMLPFCIGTGCFSIQINPNDVPLYEESYITPPDNTEELTPFSTIDGFFGSLSGPAQEVCDGLDNDCNGLVDDGLVQQYADNDNDGLGDPLEPLPCDTPGVANADDCDDNDPLIGAGDCGSCTAADQLWIAQNQQTIDGIVGAQILNCINAPDLEACLASALLNGTPLGNSCVTCIAQRYSCILSTCLQACLGGFGTANCQACVEANCQQAYLSCTGLVDADGDGSYSIVDCDDNNNGVFPGAPEVCDGQDNDCDGNVDQNIEVTYYADADGDGWGDLSNTLPGDCSVPIGYTVTPGDCDDTNNAIFPGAPDPCNGDGIDNDCDGVNDDDGIATWYVDVDADGWGDANDPGTVACGTVIGASVLGGDCDDANGSINPGTAEVPCDNIDNDCSGVVDDVDSFLWYADMDGDGFGCCNSQFACTQPQGFVALDGDCDDGDPSVFPDATELCDGIDQACDGGNERWYPDADGDTFGDGASPTFACTQPPGHVANGNDCDDTDADRYPGGPVPCPECGPADLSEILSDPQYLNGLGGFCSAECFSSGLTEACLSNCIQQNSGISANCADCIAARQFCLFNECLICLLEPGSTACQACLATSSCNSDFLLCSGLTDADLDGSPVPFDCNDNAPSVYPGANEVCDGLDNDCDGLTDEDIVITYYTDADGDGFGVDGTGVTGDCEQPVGTATQAGDCDDANVGINPNVAEVCDGIDNDCDGGIDNEAGTLYFTDADGDGYGANASGTLSCTPIPGAVTIDGDCDDTDNSINPGAADPCDSIDQDCSGGPLASAWYQDADGDGYGNEQMVLSDCAQPMGYVNNGNDCDDADDQVFPGQGCGNCTATEQAWLATHQVAFLDAFADCQGLCFGSNDPACLAQCMQGNGVPAGAICLSCLDAYVACGTEGPCATFCLNNPESCFGCLVLAGCFGDLANCLGQVDADNDGAWAGSDCNDSNSTINPFATEVCDGIDNNCNGQVDEGFPVRYADNDGDGYGDASAIVICPQPGVPVSGDCDDTDADIFPGAGCVSCTPQDIAWIANGNQPAFFCTSGCSAPTPEEVLTCLVGCYEDAGLGVPCAECLVTYQLCVLNECPDCADDPNSAACIACRQSSGCDAAFTACSGLQDNDADGYFAPDDCDDTHANVHPGATEGCTIDGLDNDCDGQVDEDATTDADADGFTLCEGDCNDQNADMNPGAVEVCDAVDNDCNGTIDDGFIVYYTDADGDGYGDPAMPQFCNPVGGVTNELDCDDSNTSIFIGAMELCDGLDNDCDQQVDEDCGVQVRARVFLEGPYNSGTGLMNDGMRSLGLVPTTEPYSGMGYPHAGSGGAETTTPSVLALSGNDAIVDWVVVELRAFDVPSFVQATRSALLQRDGDVVDVDGTSAVTFLGMPPGNYHLAVRHRNHLGVMLASPVTFSTAMTSIDLTQSSTSTYGSGACRVDGALQMLWCGDVTFDGSVKYVGAGNDRDPILLGIGSAIPTNVVSSYGQEDVNMDGAFKYVGEGNDRDPILQTVGGTVPTTIRVQQLP